MEYCVSLTVTNASNKFDEARWRENRNMPLRFKPQIVK